MEKKFIKSLFFEIEKMISGLNIFILFSIASLPKSSKMIEKCIPNFAQDSIEIADHSELDACIMTFLIFLFLIN